MEKNLRIQLQELLFSSSDKAESKRIAKLVKEGVIRKIAPKIYTSNLTDQPENIIRRNIFIILGKLYPQAVISHRSAFEFKPTPGGHIFLTYTYTKNISLPGITIHLMEGKGGMPEDTPFIEGLYLSRPERAFLENMQISRKQGNESKTLPQSTIEEKLEIIIRTNGEAAINELRDKSREVASVLDMGSEFEKLNTIISALLATHPAQILKSPLAAARAFGEPYDPGRYELFGVLFAALQQMEFKSYPDKNITERAYRNFAFFESYFSNYIEGTEFEVEDAQRIIETNQPMEARNEDSHDVLGTFYIVSNKREMSIVPGSAEELIQILQSRHRIMLSARQSKMPGMFKMQNNRAGNTNFVDFTLARGTLLKGFEYYQALRAPFAKALFIMFMISEVHPFNDGNGRIARVMMNAELSAANESKIIIPTVFRNDYLLSLRKLTRQNDPNTYINAMLKVQKFSSALYGEDLNAMKTFLYEMNAFADPEENILNLNKLPDGL